MAGSRPAMTLKERDKREEGLTEPRVRQIVAERFARPLALQAAPT